MILKPRVTTMTMPKFYLAITLRSKTSTTQHHTKQHLSMRSMHAYTQAIQHLSMRSMHAYTQAIQHLSMRSMHAYTQAIQQVHSQITGRQIPQTVHTYSQTRPHMHCQTHASILTVMCAYMQTRIGLISRASQRLATHIYGQNLPHMHRETCLEIQIHAHRQTDKPTSKRTSRCLRVRQTDSQTQKPTSSCHTISSKHPRCNKAPPEPHY